MGRTSVLSHQQKLLAIDKHRNGWKPRAIMKLLKEENDAVTLKHVRYVITQFQIGTFETVQTLETRHTEFKKLTETHLTFIADLFKNDPTLSATEIRKKLSDKNICVSKSTVFKAIRAAGWTATKPRYCQLVKDKNKVLRKQFCAELIANDEHFDNVLFTDETSIQLHDNKLLCYRPTDGIAPNFCRPKHPLKVHLWGGISRNGKTPLLIFEGIMEKRFFTNIILKRVLLPTIKSDFPDGHRFVQDNDPKHTSKYAKHFMENKSINWWKWPAESPDLNPIEMVWHMLKVYVARKNPTTKDELMSYSNEFWNEKLTTDVCNNFIDHLSKVVPVIHEMGGKASGSMPKKLFGGESSSGKRISHFNDKLKSTEAQNILRAHLNIAKR